MGVHVPPLQSFIDTIQPMGIDETRKLVAAYLYGSGNAVG